MFVVPGMGPSEHRAIFVDPVTADIRGDLVVYGTSGALPIRGWIDRQPGAGASDQALARHAGPVAAARPIVLFGYRSDLVEMGRRQYLGIACALRMENAHGVHGTWHRRAAPMAGEHDHHQAAPTPSPASPALFDAVLAAARGNGIDAGKVEIRPPVRAGHAWTVTEIDRSWPSQVDAAAVDPTSLAIVDRARFEDYPLAAKLTRWGIDAHMGALFGLPNQLALLVLAAGLAIMVAWGYRMWWRRRPALRANGTSQTLLAALRRTPPLPLLAILAGTAVVASFLPVLAVSLVAFLLLDALRYLRVRRRPSG